MLFLDGHYVTHSNVTCSNTIGRDVRKRGAPRPPQPSIAAVPGCPPDLDAILPEDAS